MLLYEMEDTESKSANNIPYDQDEGFDHESIITRGMSSGLVRGASTARSSRSITKGGYSSTRPSTYLIDEDNDEPLYDEAYTKKQASDASLVHNAAEPAVGQSKGFYQDLGEILPK